MRAFIPSVAVCACVLACGTPSRSDDGGGDGGTTNVVRVPDPGTGAMSFNWADVEPNDTPGEATPLGTSTSGDIETWVDGNTLGGADKADYFVFRSGPTAGTFLANMCWRNAGNLMDIHLFKVVDGQEPVEVASSVDPVTGTCKQLPSVAIEANTKYLVELASVTGTDTYSS